MTDEDLNCKLIDCNEKINVSFGINRHVKETTITFPKSIYQWKSCTRNKGHKKFIPFNTFNITHLPKEVRTKELLDHIKLIADLTVRIIVLRKSDKRPANCLYTCGNSVTSGTGTVVDVNKKSCSNHVSVISIKTACHVVFDSTEASSCCVDFFYDDEQNKEAVKHVQGMGVSSKDEENDWCVFECLTADTALADVLRSKLEKYSEPISDPTHHLHLDAHLSLMGNINVIVSHPHGMSKHISIGRSFPAVISEDSIYFTLFPPESFMVNHSKVAEVVGIECEVIFPDGTSSKCLMWQIDRIVQYTKEALIHEGGIHTPADQLCLEIELPNGEMQIMKENKELNYYWNALTEATRVYMKIIEC